MSFLNVNQINTAGGLTSHTTGANTIGFTSGTQTYTLGASSSSTMKNRIINGDMRIDQRNAGGSVTVSSTSALTYGVDRWFGYGNVASKFTIQQNAGSVTPPVGYVNYFGATSSSAYSVGTGDYFVLGQKIEGYNIADLGFGTANAKTITLSFQVYSSLTGTFGGAVCNGAQTRSYPFTFTVSSANTWTPITVTIPGDTGGTWVSTSAAGLNLWFGLGEGSSWTGTAGSWSSNDWRGATGAVSVVGTTGATFYITGVQLEVGSTSTSFDFRHYQQELAMCQRYFEKSYDQGTAITTPTQSGTTYISAASDGSGSLVTSVNFAVVKRVSPTITFYTHTGTSGTWYWSKSGISETTFATMFTLFIGTRVMNCYGNTSSNWVPAYMYGHWTASAEL